MKTSKYVAPGFFIVVLLLSLWVFVKATPALAAGETCSNGQPAPCQEDALINGCKQCHSIIITSGNRNNTDRVITAAGGTMRHINDPKSADWTSNVQSMITKGAVADLELASGYLNTNYCSSCTGPIMSSPAISNITTNSATVAWTTSANGFGDHPASSVVFYGTNKPDVLLGPGCSSCQNVSDPTLVAAHTVNLTGLSPRTTYYVVAQSVSSLGTARNTYAMFFRTKSDVPVAIPSRLYLSNVTATGGKTIVVADPQTNAIVGSISVSGSATWDVASNPDGGTVYATLEPNTMVIDVEGNLVTATINVGGVRLSKAAFSPNGTRAYVAAGNFNNTGMPASQNMPLRVIDTANNAVLQTVTFPSGCHYAYGLGVHPSGSPLYVACASADSTLRYMRFFTMNTTTMAITQTHIIQVNDPASLAVGDLAVSSDGNRIYVISAPQSGSTAEVYRVYNGSGALLSTVTINASGAAKRLALSPNGSRLYVIGTEGANNVLHVMDAPANTKLLTRILPSALNDVAVNVEGTRVFVSRANLVQVVDATTLADVATISGSQINSAGFLTITPGRAGAPLPDLVMDQVVRNAATAARGETLSVTDTVKNVATAGFTDPAFSVAYNLSTNTTQGDGDDIPLTAFRSVNPLGAGSTDTATLALLIPATTTAGNYYVCAKADSADDVLETDETNNALCSSATFLVTGADLDMTQLTAGAASVPVGRVISVTDTVMNQGAASTNASFGISYRLSTTPNYDTGSPVSNSRAVGPLAGGASSAATTGLLIPITATPGNYYICAKADSANTVNETDEINNAICTASTISVQ